MNSLTERCAPFLNIQSVKDTTDECYISAWGRGLESTGHCHLVKTPHSVGPPSVRYLVQNSLWSPYRHRYIFNIILPSFSTSLKCSVTYGFCDCRLLRICTACPTRCRTRHFFNHSYTSGDIATKFEQEYVRCVRNEKECVCIAPNSH